MRGIYALVDPRTRKVRYVGQSTNIEKRFEQHVANRDRGCPRKSAWICELAALGIAPLLERLATNELGSLDEDERAWIRHYREYGEADLNIAAGGSHATGEDWASLFLLIREAVDAIQRAELAAAKCDGARGCDIVNRSKLALEKARSRLLVRAEEDGYEEKK